MFDSVLKIPLKNLKSQNTKQFFNQTLKIGVKKKEPKSNGNKWREKQNLLMSVRVQPRGNSKISKVSAELQTVF